MPQQKAVTVLGGEHHVFHAGGFGDMHPFAGVEICRIEFFVKVVIDRDGYLAIVRTIGVGIGARPTDFLSSQADRSPMNEHPESCRAPPCQSRAVLRGGFGPGHRCECANDQREQLFQAGFSLHNPPKGGCFLQQFRFHWLVFIILTHCKPGNLALLFGEEY